MTDYFTPCTCAWGNKRGDFNKHHRVREQSKIPDETQVVITTDKEPVDGQVVKGRQYSAYTVQATSMPAPQSQRWNLRLTLDLDNDKFQSQDTNLTAPYSF